MPQLITFFQSQVSRDEHGATAVEYAIMVALIAIVIVAAVTLIGTNLNSSFSEAATGVANA